MRQCIEKTWVAVWIEVLFSFLSLADEQEDDFEDKQ